jgi:acyl-CoA hydrolase
VASAYLVFVAVDADGKPREVPQVVPETDEDRRRLREAEIRRSHRLARRAAIIASREDDAREKEAAERTAVEQAAPACDGGADSGDDVR